MLFAPSEWDRYYQVHTDLDAVLGTPGLPTAAFGEAITAAGATFTQSADPGFFLVAAEQPPGGDPLDVSAAISGPLPSGAIATINGPRRGRSRDTATGTHIDVEQLVRGARVIGGEMRLHQDDSGVFAVTGRPLGDIAERDPGPARPVATDDALSTCAERFELEQGLQDATVEQVVFPDADGARWAYEVAFVVPEHSADVRVYLRADDLSLLLSHNVSSAATARVFDVNPLRTPTLIDVTLEGLDEPGNLLRGTSIDVIQAVGQRIQRDDGDFAVDPSEPAFDEVQAYHHLWQVTKHFERIADASLLIAKPFTPMTALVNDPRSPNNAYFTPTTGDLRFGLFGSRSSARSAAIVYHEFGHAVTDSICKLGRAKVQNTESRGLSEGYSDYFAASFLDDPRLGDFVADDVNGARNCSDPDVRFPPAFKGEEHETGAAWAAVLWALRNRIGGATADKLVIESVEFVGSSSSFNDAHAALHLVDARLFASANKDAIDEEFSARAGD